MYYSISRYHGCSKLATAADGRVCIKAKLFPKIYGFLTFLTEEVGPGTHKSGLMLSQIISSICSNSGPFTRTLRYLQSYSPCQAHTTRQSSPPPTLLVMERLLIDVEADMRGMKV